MTIETVKIPGKNYAFGKYPITQEQYQSVMGRNPSYFEGKNLHVEWVGLHEAVEFDGKNLPVEKVLWCDAVEFCEKLTARERKLGHISENQEYRLPTSEEWDHACRAGTTTQYYTGDSEADLARAGWYKGNSAGKTHPVGEKEPNAFGLYDMHGNVWEWTSTSRGSWHVYKGGSLRNIAHNCRSAVFDFNSPDFRRYDLGFRVVLGEIFSKLHDAPETVNIPGKPYAFGKYPITQKQYESVTGKNPSEFKDENLPVENNGVSAFAKFLARVAAAFLPVENRHRVVREDKLARVASAVLPVENVSWHEAVEFCKALTARERRLGRIAKNQEYRLPTSEEWEHACRAGTTTKYYTGDSESDLARAGWYGGSSGNKTHPVGRKESNAFGLYDMHGNVWEWTSTPDDERNGSCRAYRGGSWYDGASDCESSNRGYYSPDYRNSRLGFRIVLGKISPAYYDVPETVQIPGKSYAFGKYPITQKQYESVTGENPSLFKGGNLPVEMVSWNDAMEFCKALTERERELGHIAKNQEYRLPTSKEWEHACRAGTTTQYYTGDSEADLDRAGWYLGNSGYKTHPVGEKEPNAFGLYDMHGNVWEWTSTPNRSRRVRRGGSWGDDSGDEEWELSLGSSCSPGIRDNNLGFRVVLAEIFPVLSDVPETVEIPWEEYAFGKYPVTQGQYEFVTGENPSLFKGGNLPVENVSWDDANWFCKKLTERERKLGHISENQEYRLPTSKEWEYACRAETETKYYTGDSEADLDRAGWYCKNSGDETHPVGQKEPNAFGLYDMHGNVREWTSTWNGRIEYDSFGYVYRGGSWSSSASGCESSEWSDISPFFCDDNLGFRVVLAKIR